MRMSTATIPPGYAQTVRKGRGGWLVKLNMATERSIGGITWRPPILIIFPSQGLLWIWLGHHIIKLSVLAVHDRLMDVEGRKEKGEVIS